MGVQSLITPLRIGLTGGIGTGKTTVTDLFADLSVPVIDADKISHEVETKGQPGYKKIIEQFGSDIIDKNGDLRRDHLRKLIFNNPELKQQLESIIHPEVRKIIKERINKVRHPYCIISIPLLFESGLQKSVDRILVIDAPEKLQISRASSRDGVTTDDIRKIIRLQIDRGTRLQQADDIIVNDRDRKHLERQVEIMDRKYLNLAKEHTIAKTIK